MPKAKPQPKKRTTPRDNKIRQHKKALLEALEQSLGVVTEACNAVGIHRSMFYKYYNEDAAFKEAVDDLENVALDFAESQLHSQIRSGEVASTIFYLKTKGKSRGYIEKSQQEITGKDGLPQEHTVKVILPKE